MPSKEWEYSSLVKLICEQLDMSQEDLARELGVSLASVNRWKHGQATPSKLAKAQLQAFCDRKVQDGSLNLAEVEKSNGPRRSASRRGGRGKR
ncbi:MAG: helix-turn-helix domain-containing protein [Acidobacteriota bacterium]